MVNNGLELTEDDIYEQFVDIPVMDVRFHHFPPRVQEKILQYRKATFFKWKGTERESCCVLYPPK